MAEAAEKSYSEKMVEALLLEREGYVERGLTDRVQQVDKQIVAHGGEVPEGSKRGRGKTAEERAAEKAAKEAEAAEKAAAAKEAEEAAKKAAEGSGQQ